MELGSVRVPAALDVSDVAVFAHAVAAAAADTATRVVVLEGSADGTFCRGLDLSGFDFAVSDPAIAVRAFAECLASLRLATKPTLAVVDGVVLGGGVGIVAACDVVVATPRSIFGLPELLSGLLPAIVLPVLLERIPVQKARLLALQAASIGAEEAYQLGLVDEVVAQDALPRAVNGWKRRLARPEPDVVGALKRHLSADLHAALQEGAEITAARLQAPRVQSALRAFQDGEAAPWLAT